jgi:4-hydroxy-2-oxoheptanedioate aldolase
MADTPRPNGAIRALEQGKPAFTAFAAPEINTAQAIGAAAYDAVVFEMEHNPYDIKSLRDCMQYMLDRKQILKSGSLAPAVAPFVRIPPNGAEMSQWLAKQVLDIGVYGVVWPHVSTVEEARNAVAASRYPRPPNAPHFDPAGQRGDGPTRAARYWGLTQELGVPRQYDHPTVVFAMDEILAICREHNVVCGHPHVDAKNVEALLVKGYRWLMAGPSQSFGGLQLGLKTSGRV